ncbi:nocturnin, partial [Reticulomyxa filosa]
FFKHYLQGYEGIFAPKKSSPCTKIGKEMGKAMLPDGVAIFYKSKSFKTIFSRLYGVSEKEKVDVAAAVVHLRRSQTGHSDMNDLIVVCTHLKSAKDMEGEVQRLKQIQYLASEMLQYQEKVEQEIRKYIPIFIGCDLNAPPKDTKGFPPFTYASIVDDKLFKNLLQTYKEKNSKNAQSINLNMKLYQKTYNKLRFTSAYKSLLGSEPKYTTWKKRKGGEDKHTIDYLFFQHFKGVVVTSVLNIPDERTVNRESLLPGWEYPSDHFAIMASFEF